MGGWSPVVIMPGVGGLEDGGGGGGGGRIVIMQKCRIFGGLERGLGGGVWSS